jgi:hypothetical protein
MSIASASWFSTISGVPESFCSQERWQQFHWVESTKHSWSIPCSLLYTPHIKVHYVLGRHKWIHWSLWCSCQPQREYVYFDEVRKTKVWNYNPLISSMLYLASTQGTMHPIMGDVVLGKNFPHSTFFDYSWLMALQRAWGVFVLTSRFSSFPPKCSF